MNSLSSSFNKLSLVQSSFAWRFVRSVTSTPAIIRPISAIFSCFVNGVTLVVVLPSFDCFVIKRWVSAIAATCGKWVMHKT